MIFLFLQVLILFTKISGLFLMTSCCLQMFSFLKNHFKHNGSRLCVCNLCISSFGNVWFWECVVVDSADLDSLLFFFSLVLFDCEVMA